MRITSRWLFLAQWLGLFSLLNVPAQQAIVNLPSADITPKGKHFIMHETQWRPWNPGRYWYATNFYCYGIGKNTELAVTTYNSGTPQALNENIGVGFKTALPLFQKRHPAWEMKWTVGQMVTYNLRGRGLGGFTYSHGSLVVPQTHTRLTAGVSFGTKNLFKKTTVHPIAAVEQPLIKHRLYLLGEWFYGRHDFGFFTPGILFHPTKNQIIVVAYKIPNHPGNGKGGIVFEYGFFFGGKENGPGTDTDGQDHAHPASPTTTPPTKPAPHPQPVREL
ncbi:hypothetical protein J8C02_01480 [Chloracidobacterium sp. MS 40/45]|uniref:hypothetical protein n=1 Tax=Chloracidobacterium aggregatum TaxID=2851959 RepID=UPI001B8A9C9C|nr:hypothetical protein [Chloracidobacterium aggregatum]QUW00216.1 hypothetical protein J8C02_01480 [Chloracidobacterium sp. MS 40/45]